MTGLRFRIGTDLLQGVTAEGFAIGAMLIDVGAIGVLGRIGTKAGTGRTGTKTGMGLETGTGSGFVFIGGSGFSFRVVTGFTSNFGSGFGTRARKLATVSGYGSSGGFAFWLICCCLAFCCRLSGDWLDIVRALFYPKISSER